MSFKLSELAHKRAKTKGKKQAQEDDGDPFGDAVQEAWEASKKEDVKGFAKALKSAVRIAMNTADTESEDN